MPRLPPTRDQLVQAPPERFAHPHTVRLQEVDAAGVVFFGHYFGWFNDALLAWFEHVGKPVHRWIVEHKRLAPVKQAHADYVAPARFGDKLETGLLFPQLDETGFSIGYRIHRRSDSQVVAVGYTVHVIVDAERFQRAEISPEFRALFTALE